MFPAKSVASVRMWLELLSLAAVILGVPFFFLQQYEQSRMQKVQQTLAFVSIFQSDRLTTEKAEALRPWFAYRDEISRLNSGDGIGRSMLDRWVLKMIEVDESSNPRGKLLNSIFDVADFFDQLHLCVKARACDEPTSREYFGTYAAQFCHLYGTVIVDLRSGMALSDLGKGVAYFSARPEETCTL